MEQKASARGGVNGMLTVVIIPEAGLDASRLLRDKVTHEARTLYWKDRRKTRLAHKEIGSGYIEIGEAKGTVVAEIRADGKDDIFFLAEKLIGACVRWFQSELSGITIQFRRQTGGGEGRRERKGRG